MGFRFLYPPLDRAGGYPCLYFPDGSCLVDCGSDASLDDLPTADFTVEAWAKPISAGFQVVIGKGGFDQSPRNGWDLSFDGNSRIRLIVYADDSYKASTKVVTIGGWLHVAGFWDVSAGKSRVSANGAWTNWSDALAPAYVGDAALNLKIGNLHGGAWDFTGHIGWIRISNSDRYSAATGIGFTPPPRYPPPAVDANTIEQWNLDDGTGSTAAAQVSSPTNDGTITNAVWKEI